MQNRPQYVVLHHNGVAGRDIHDIDRTHRANGWRMVGYHYVIREDGVVQRGRPESMPGAHCRGLNARSVGVCVIGAEGEWVDDFAFVTVVLAKVAELQEAYAIPRANVIGHREVNGLLPARYHVRKSCPGRQVDMDAFRRWLPVSRGDK